ncbi:alpha/beta hydrolase [Thiothrix winogradskyi]|uniref:Alpha/beta hydrolase n=1 Tax=Thiothrix winogradskyi TaxID=96472 RepID=A0ABY3SVA6_9GAMM|nr:dienelactone hydrolase family protein [Thiothrix winogradskyi]UJS23074.1 alpha/beta hydrolase [Thiothrix winogradskyi]
MQQSPHQPPIHYLPAVEVEPTSPATAAVIWLHGLGADGHDFVPIIPELGLPPDHGIRFIFPHAPALPVTVNGGYVMPAWYDILEIDLDRKVDVAQLQTSAHEVGKLIEREIARGIPSERIVIAGFSQGGAVAYQSALSYPKPLAGLLALSTYFATTDTVDLNAANAQLPIHIFHGKQDTIVPDLLALKACRWLRERGYAPAYSEYPLGHNVFAEEIAEVGRCLRKWLN